MEYLSTRGEIGNITFESVLLNGLARDGGLYLPKKWPKFSFSELSSMKALTYHDIASAIISKFTGDDLNIEEVTQLAKDSYKNFTHSEVAPVKSLDEGLYTLELTCQIS